MDKNRLSAIKREIIAKIDTAKDISDEDVLELIDERLKHERREHYFDLNQRMKLRRDIFNSLRRLDVLQDLIEDNEISEIMVNGPDRIFVEKKGRLYLSERSFESRAKLEDIIQRMASGVNRSVNEAHPIVDARLADGSRVNVVLPPVALDGPNVTIRKFSKEFMSMEKLVSLGSISEEAADYLGLLVRSNYNILCSGGTGCGKSTLLNALARFIPLSERVVTIEDSAELDMSHLPNLVRMEAKTANVEGRGAITIRELIKTALRMRPDRLIVGEVRGRECIDMLQSLNTGHSGMSTAHANSPEDVLSRLETMVLLDENIPLSAVRSQIASAIDIIIGISRMRDSSRRITKICETDGIVNGEIVLRTLFEFREEGKGRKVTGRLVKVSDIKHHEKLVMAGLEDEFKERRRK